MSCIRREKISGLVVSGSLWAALLTLVVSCAAERAPRNTVQHNVIAKEDLLGVDGKATWHYLRTITDVPYNTGFTFAGEQSLLEKIRWEIQEGVLYARRSYEYIRNTDKTSSKTEQGTDPNKVKGAPIAAFKIEKHFDIVRDYNSATGEEINHIIENDSDRPWYQRKFMRVDWSRNLVTDFNFLIQWADDGVVPMKMESVPYYVSDPADPDAIRIRRPKAEKDQPRPTANYFEVTTKQLVSPEQVTEHFVDGKYTMPACYLAEDYGPSFSSSDCAPQEIKLRHSFKLVAKRDYDPVVYDDRWMERFGYFSTERQSYDRHYMETESGRVRLGNRFNIWNKVLSAEKCSLKDYFKSAADPRKEIDAARRQANAHCVSKVGAKSICSEYVERCTLPPLKREGINKIVYYTNVGFPEALSAAAKASVASWNDVLQLTAIRMLYPTDSQRDAALLTKRRKEIGDVFELKVNDCSEANVNAFVGKQQKHVAPLEKALGLKGPTFKLEGKALIRACSALEQATAFAADGERFEWQRIGDLRYSMLYWVGVPTRAALFGYGPSSVDPETGEIIQGNAFLYGALVDWYAARAADIVGLLNCGDQKCVDSYAQGVPIRDWVALTKGQSQQNARTLDKATIKKIGGAMKLDWLKAAAAKLPPLDWKNLESLHRSRRARATALANSKLLGQNGSTSATRLSAIKGTALDKKAQNQFLAAIGRSKTSSSSSFVNWADRRYSQARRKAKMRLAGRTVELASFFDDAVFGLALRYKEQKKSRDAIIADMRGRILAGLAQHEIGHTLGLRHNFAASYDALNYRPGYWKLRQVDSLGSALPRYKKPMNKAEREGIKGDPQANEGLGSYQYSSVMDYGARFNSDIAGLGYYDQAAIKFGYGQLVEVFDKISPATPDKYMLVNALVSIRWGEPLLFTVSCDGLKYRSLHYTEYPRLVGGAKNLGGNNRLDVSLHEMQTTKLSKIAPGCAVYQWGGLWDSDVPTDKSGRIEVPFRFCSDEFEGSSPDCSAFDFGADVYETTQNTINLYQNYYLWRNLKLDRLGFSYYGYSDSLLWNFFEPLRSSMQFYVLSRGDLTGDPRNATYLGDQEMKEFFTADNGYGPWTVAVDDSLNFLLKVLSTPEVGDYWLDANKRLTQSTQYDAQGNEKPVDLKLGVPQAKYLNSTWDFDSGYFWYDKMTRVGVFFDKYLALWALTDPDTSFLGRDTSTDLRQYSISYHRLYPDLLNKIFRGVLTDDWSLTAPYATSKALVQRSYSVPFSPPAGASPVDPQMGYSIQFFTALLGVSQIPRTFDTAFIDSCRIWVVGGEDQITPITTPVCYDDDDSKKRYCSVSYKDSSGAEQGIGAGMIARANQLKATFGTSKSLIDHLELRQYIDTLDLMRSVTHAFAYSPH